MDSISKTIKNYDSISKAMKHLPKSILRLKILKFLYENPSSMKEMNRITNIDYSAISTNIHKLELEGFLVRKNSKYFLSNEMKLYMDNLIELDRIMLMLDDIFPILHNHTVQPIPLYSVCNISELEHLELLESDDLDVYKTYDYIEKSIKRANYINAILPFSHEEFNYYFNRLILRGIEIDLMIPVSIGKVLIKNLDTSKRNLNLRFFDDDETNQMLLICTDKKMMLGLFKNDGRYDQNRLLVSHNEKSINWANDLFENFKKENL